MAGRTRWGSVGAMLALAVAAGGALAASPPRIVGTLRASGPVSISLDDVAWQPIRGGPVGEGAVVRTEAGGSATVDVAGGDVLGLAEATRMRVTSAVPPAVTLEDGRLVATLQPASTTTVDTPGGIVRVPLGAPPTGMPRTAVIAITDGTTSVEVRAGDVDVLQPGGAVLTLEEGQRATLGPQAATTTVADLDAPEADPDHLPRRIGNPASDPRMKPSPLMAQFWVAIAVIGAGFIAGIGML